MSDSSKNYVLELIEGQMKERNWSLYRLALMCGLSNSTICNLFKRNNSPTIPTLEIICDGFGLSLAQLFASGPDNPLGLDEYDKELFFKWHALTEEQQKLMLGLMRNMKPAYEIEETDFLDTIGSTDSTDSEADL